MLRIAIGVGAAVLIAGCSGGHRKQPPPQPLSAQNPVSAAMPPSSPAEYRRPIRIYRRHVLRQLAAMSGDVAAMRAAIASGDAAAARSAWRAANAHYQTIGAAYGAFGDLDAAVDGTTAGLPGGDRDPHFTGLHRVELALFGRDSIADAVRPAEVLQRSLARMRARVPKLDIDPLEYSLRAHEVMEDTLHLQLTGQASPWSGYAYDAVAANVEGTRVVLNSLTPLIDARSQGARVAAERSLDRLDRSLRALRRRHHGYPALRDTPQVERERIAALVAAAAEQLALVPELIDPRGARPVRGAFGERAQ